MSVFTINVKRTFSATRERVFKAWMDPEDLHQWWGPPGFTMISADVDLRVGGRYRFVKRTPDGNIMSLTGVFREILPPEKLVYTWMWENPGGNSEETVVTVEFRDRGSATEVLLTHERFSAVEARDQHADGWNACLDRLEGMFTQ